MLGKLKQGLVAACALALTAQFAYAQTAPPIKPGLWQVRSEREVDGQKGPDPMERLKTLPPEARKQIEATMREKGVGLGSDGRQTICHSRESLEQGAWRGSDARCKTDIKSRSNTSWKWHSVCSDPAFEMDGDAVFTRPESYVVNTQMTSMKAGKAQTMKMTVTADWLGADCGGLKPMQAPPAGK